MTNIFEQMLRPGRRLLRWWLAEIAALIPPAIRRKLSGRQDLLVLALHDDEAILTRHDAGGVRLLGRVSLASGREPTDSELAAAISDRDLQRRIRRGSVQVGVRLPSAKALTTRVTLPLAVEENLRQVMDFELDRRTPFSSSDVHFAHRIISRDETADQIQVELTVVARPVVAEALATAERFGLKPTIVDVGRGDQPASGNLLVEDNASPMRQSHVLLRRAACVALVAFGGIALYWPVYVAHQTADELGVQVQEAKKLAAEASRLRSEITRLADDDRYLVDYRRKTPTVTEILSELTRVLPDNTWLGQLVLNANEAQLAGFSASASSLVQLIGQSPLFVEPKFRSAVVFDPSISRERFEMATTILKRDTP